MSADFAHMSSVRAHASVVSTQRRDAYLYEKSTFTFQIKQIREIYVLEEKKSETMKIQFKYKHAYSIHTQLSWDEQTLLRYRKQIDSSRVEFTNVVAITLPSLYSSTIFFLLYLRRRLLNMNRLLFLYFFLL